MHWYVTLCSNQGCNSSSLERQSCLCNIDWATNVDNSPYQCTYRVCSNIELDVTFKWISKAKMNLCLWLSRRGAMHWMTGELQHPPPPVMHFVTLRYISLTNQFETYKDDSRCVCFKRRNALQVVTLCCKPSLPVRQSCMLQHCCNFVIHVDQFQQLKYLDFVGVHQSCLLLYWAPCESVPTTQNFCLLVARVVLAGLLVTLVATRSLWVSCSSSFCLLCKIIHLNQVRCVSVKQWMQARLQSNISHCCDLSNCFFLVLMSILHQLLQPTKTIWKCTLKKTDRLRAKSAGKQEDKNW